MLDLIFNGLDRLSNLLYAVSSWICAGLLAAICLLVGLQVVTRQIGIPVSWSFELVTFFLIWMVFLGASMAHRAGEVLALTFLTDRLSRTVALAVAILVEIVLIVFLLVAIYFNQPVIGFAMSQISPVLRAPMGYVSMSISVAFCFFAIYATANIVNLARQLGGSKLVSPT